MPTADISARLPLREIWRQPLPFQGDVPATRGLCRLMTWTSRRFVSEIRGLAHIDPSRDPFVLALNHSQRLEAVLIPSRLIYHRRGKGLHFLADWPFMLVPFVALLYRRSGVIVVTAKRARPAWLNVFKPLFRHPTRAYDRALAHLRAGASVGVFPEGTINRNPRELLRGATGAARLALDAGVPVVPAGIRFPDHTEAARIPDGARMCLDIGPPIHPPSLDRRPARSEIDSFHERLMRAIAERCGKRWQKSARRRRQP